MPEEQGYVAGVTFSNQVGRPFYSTSKGYDSLQASYTVQTLTIGNNSTNAFSSVTGGEGNLNKVLSSMVYNSMQAANTKTRMAFNSLEEGKTYTIRMLTRPWTVDDNRKQDFSIDLNADGQADSFTYNGVSVTSQRVSEDKPFGDSYAGAYAVDFTFVAQSSTASLTLTNVNYNKSWHNYGAVLFENNVPTVTPTTPTIYNPSFEADTFVIYDRNTEHGYINEAHSGVISGWQFVNNTTPTAIRAGLAWTGSPCTHFLGNQTPTDGNQVAFLQSDKSADTRLYQTISGFNPSDSSTCYRLTFDASKRNGYGDPNVSVYLDDTAIYNKSITDGFKSYSAIVRPTASSQTLAFGNKTAGDTTLLLDNVQLKSYKMFNCFTDTFSVKETSNTISPSDNDNPNRFGGYVGPTTYTKYNTVQDDQVRVENSEMLRIATRLVGWQGNSANISPDHNFMDYASDAGQMYELSFETMPVSNENIDLTNWSGVIFGVSNASRGAIADKSDGVGIIFRKNGGVAIFDDNVTVCELSDAYTLDDDGWADVSIQYFVPSFDTDSLVDVCLFINDKFIYSFQTDDGFTDNYFSLLSFSNGITDSSVYSYFKNVSMSSSAIPEPSTWALLILGSIGLFWLRRKR